MSLSDGYTPQARAFDLNSDGIDEIEVEEGCGSSGCWGTVYQLRNGSWARILDDLVDTVHKGETGFMDAFNTKKIYMPGGGFVDGTIKYEWDGKKYVVANTTISPENMQAAARSTREFISSERDQDRRVSGINNMVNVFGASNALDILLMSQMPPDVPMPTDERYDRLLIELSRERGIDYTRFDGNPQGLKSALFGSLTSPLLLQPTTPGGFITTLGILTARNIADELGRGEYSRYVGTLRRVDGNLDAYIRQTGKEPTPQELHDLLTRGAAMSIYEEDIPDRTPLDTSSYRRTESPTGTTETRSFNPLDVPGDNRYLNRQPVQQKPDVSRQIDQQSQQQLRQGAERGRQMAGR